MNPKRKKKSLLEKGGAAAIMVSLGILSLQRALAATQTLPVQANLLRAIEVTLNASLDFGTLAMTVDRAGVATIDPFINKLFVDGNSSLTAVGGEPRAGQIQIKGAAKPITISMENPSVRLTNGVTTLTVNNFNFQTLMAGSRVTITPTSDAEPYLLSIGATINTKPGQLTGTYIGANRIFANFQ
jgi:hypothetical protein